MTDLSFQVRARIRRPLQRNAGAQSLYVFGMHHTPSLITAHICNAIDRFSDHAAFDVPGALERLGVALIDEGDPDSPASFVDPSTFTLDQLGTFGGYLYYGFGGIPLQYANRFLFSAAAVLIARDPRDILVANYQALSSAAETESGGSVRSLSEDAYVVSESALDFARRAVQPCLILKARGVPLMRCEDYVSRGAFHFREFVDVLASHLAPYLQLTRHSRDVGAVVQQEGSAELKDAIEAFDRAAGSYRALDRKVAETLTSKLSPELISLGYL